MTIDDLALVMQKEFKAVRGEMNEEFASIRTEMAGMATKEDLRAVEERLSREILGIHGELHQMNTWMRDLDGRVGFLETKIR